MAQLTPFVQVKDTDIVIHKMRLDANVYATKKTIAQGMLDIALLTANASQLKYIIQVGPGDDFYYPLVTLIGISIILQVSIGLSFIYVASLDINNPDHHTRANVLNNVITAAIFTVTVINVLVSAFGMKQSDDDVFRMKLKVEQEMAAQKSK